ncbi:MAG TPA: hypothetical protein VGA04_08765 [Streptosporangiaceae bacterium]
MPFYAAHALVSATTGMMRAFSRVGVADSELSPAGLRAAAAVLIASG